MASFGPRYGRGGRMQRFMALRLALLAPVLIAAFALHLSGTALVVLHVVRIAVIALVIVVAGALRRRRRARLEA